MTRLPTVVLGVVAHRVLDDATADAFGGDGDLDDRERDIDDALEKSDDGVRGVDDGNGDLDDGIGGVVVDTKDIDDDYILGVASIISST